MLKRYNKKEICSELNLRTQKFKDYQVMQAIF